MALHVDINRGNKHSITNLLVLTLIVVVCHSCKPTQWMVYRTEPSTNPIGIAINDYFDNYSWWEMDKNYVELDIQEHCSKIQISLHFYDTNDYTCKFYFSGLTHAVDSHPYDKVPTDYIEQGGKLFVWHNPNKVLTWNMIDKLIDYNRVYFNTDSNLVVLTGAPMRLIYRFNKFDITRYCSQIGNYYETMENPCSPNRKKNSISRKSKVKSRV